LKKDLNKNITSIQYNYLKLPKRIDFSNGSWLTYEYDAAGKKLRKISPTGIITDYVSNRIYENNTLYQSSHDEGRINAQGQYEFNITDHNNDLRVAFRDSLGIAVPTQSIFYDPWGLSMKGMQITRNLANFNKFQFLNRETQFETGYIDLIHRQFDPVLGRFISPDPVTESQEHLSLYQYGWNNPVLKSDPNGQMPCCGDIDWKAAGEGFVKGVVVGAVGAVAVTALIASGGTAAPLIGYGLAAYGAYETGKTGYEVVSGKEAYTGRELSNSERSEKGGELIGGFVGGGLGAKSGLGGKIAGEAAGETKLPSLETRANDIHSTVPKATQSRTTIAVAEATTADGKSVRLVGSSEARLRPAQRSALQTGEIATTGKGHAEVTVLNHAKANGMTVQSVAASRPICSGCATAIQNSGASASSSLKKIKMIPYE
jgi:RHS repeat-associated protein